MEENNAKKDLAKAVTDDTFMEESLRYPIYKMLQSKGVDVEYTDVGLAVRHGNSLFGIIIDKC